jgi:hypothetical protein
MRQSVSPFGNRKPIILKIQDGLDNGGLGKGGRLKMILVHITSVNIIHNLHVAKYNFMKLMKELVGLTHSNCASFKLTTFT